MNNKELVSSASDLQPARLISQYLHITQERPPQTARSTKSVSYTSHRSCQQPMPAKPEKVGAIIARLLGLRKQFLNIMPNLRYLLLSAAQSPFRIDHPVRILDLLGHGILGGNSKNRLLSSHFAPLF